MKMHNVIYIVFISMYFATVDSQYSEWRFGITEEKDDTFDAYIKYCCMCNPITYGKNNNDICYVLNKGRNWRTKCSCDTKGAVQPKCSNYIKVCDSVRKINFPNEYNVPNLVPSNKYIYNTTIDNMNVMIYCNDSLFLDTVYVPKCPRVKWDSKLDFNELKCIYNYVIGVITNPFESKKNIMKAYKVLNNYNRLDETIFQTYYNVAFCVTIPPYKLSFTKFKSLIYKFPNYDNAIKFFNKKFNWVCGPLIAIWVILIFVVFFVEKKVLKLTDRLDNLTKIVMPKDPKKEEKEEEEENSFFSNFMYKQNKP